MNKSLQWIVLLIILLLCIGSLAFAGIEDCQTINNGLSQCFGKKEVIKKIEKVKPQEETITINELIDVLIDIVKEKKAKNNAIIVTTSWEKAEDSVLIKNDKPLAKGVSCITKNGEEICGAGTGWQNME